MSRLPDRMTDAAYQRTLRDAEKRLARSQEVYTSARSTWEASSVLRCGLKRYLVHWLHFQKTRGDCRKKQDELHLLRNFKRIPQEKPGDQ